MTRAESFQDLPGADKARLLAMAETMAGVGHWRFDLLDQHIFWSANVHRITGVAVGLVPISCGQVLDCCHPDDQEALVRGMNRALAGDAPEALRLRILHPDGTIRHVILKMVLDISAPGVKIALFGVVQDVTERHNLEAALEARQMEADAALTIRSHFLANMNHEIRTPLNAIIGFTTVMRQSPDLPREHRRQVDLVWEGSQALLSLVNDVLDFSGLESGRFAPNLTAFAPGALLLRTLSLLEHRVDGCPVSLTCEAEGLPDALIGDAGRIRQVTLNLLSNAAKFTERGDIRLSARLLSDPLRLRVEVSDTGIGIPAEHLDAIFTRFFQGDASRTRKYGGTGLGLAICRQIMTALGGEIGVDSVVGRGSTFWFEAPVGQAGAVDGDDVGSDPVEAPAFRLLVVDDNALNRELICRLLAPFPIEITTACDGAEAVAVHARGTFDMIFMDVHMPIMDGLAATRAIRRAEGAQARTPIIAVTADVLPAQVEACLRAGMDDHLGKPIQPAGLLRVMTRWAPAPGLP